MHGLNVCEVPAISHGNLIEISTGVVGVEEACSGIRSFQSALMAALFLGQFFVFRWPVRSSWWASGRRRLSVSNVFRAGILTAIADKDGIPALEKWHDPAGYTILLICFGILTAAALGLKPEPRLRLLLRLPGAFPPCPAGFTLGLTAWVLFAIAGTEAWYRLGHHIPAPWWRVELPTDKPGFARVPLSAEINAMQPDEAMGGRWWEGDKEVHPVFLPLAPGAGHLADAGPLSPAGNLPARGGLDARAGVGRGDPAEGNGRACPSGLIFSRRRARRCMFFSACGRMRRAKRRRAGGDFLDAGEPLAGGSDASPEAGATSNGSRHHRREHGRGGAGRLSARDCASAPAGQSAQCGAPGGGRPAARCEQALPSKREYVYLRKIEACKEDGTLYHVPSPFLSPRWMRSSAPVTVSAGIPCPRGKMRTNTGDFPPPPNA